MRVIKLVFKDDCREEYYGCISAIFAKYGRDKLGAVKGTIYNHMNYRKEDRYENSKIIIERKIVTKSQSRKK